LLDVLARIILFDVMVADVLARVSAVVVVDAVTVVETLD